MKTEKREDVCPNRDLLASHLLGKVRGEEAYRLEQHIANCPSCSQALRELEPQGERDEQIRCTTQTNQTAATVAVQDPEQNAADREADFEAGIETNFDFLQPPQQPDEMGRLGDYRVLEVMGVGGMGVVFRAEDPELERTVALKAMKPSVAASRTARVRFVREARATAAIEHDNIVPIYQVGQDQGIPFIAMRFLRGQSLQGLLSNKSKLPANEVAAIGRQIAAGLAAAHKRGLIHRDIKPANIWMEEETGRVKILDFGLARSYGQDTGLTQSGIVLGTPKYMAPEQANTETVDHRCDLFSLGGVLYHMASGEAPFEGGNVTATLIAVSQADCQPIGELCPELDSDLADLITSLLAKAPAARPQSASEVADALAKIQQQLEAGQSETKKQQGLAESSELTPSASLLEASPSTSRKPILLGGAFVAVAIAVLLGLWAAGVLFKVERQNGTLDRTNQLGRDWHGWSADAPPPAIAPLGAEQTEQLQKAWAAHLGVPVEKQIELPGGEKLTMTLIPPGDFLMGSTDELRARLLQEAKEANDTLAIERIPSEGPQHRVRITQPYWLSHHEVTLGQFRQFVEQTQYKTDAERDGNGGFGKLDGGWTQAPQFVWNADLGFSQSDNSPVVNVSWNDAVAFCQWLSTQQPGLAFSLPTEAQWEYACRAGTTTVWHFGDSEAALKKHGWYQVNSSDGSHPVGQLTANAFGLYDMHGNLMEWCADSYSADYYASSPANDPNDHTKGARRVLRGGSWNRYPRSCRSAYRDHGGRGSRSHSLGFRVTSVVAR